jgi:hypothetical protein
MLNILFVNIVNLNNQNYKIIKKMYYNFVNNYIINKMI